MKRLLALILAASMMFSMVACSSPSKTEDKPDSSSQEETTSTVSEEDLIDDEAWDELASIGKIETENGILTVSITFPADFVGEDVDEAELNKDAGEHYISAKLNDDGSVTMKMTKKQHKAMLDEMMVSMEESLQGLIDDETFSYTEIKHNKNFSKFDVTVAGEELNLADSFGVLGLYMFGGMYQIFAGTSGQNIEVNFYSPSGNLITTANSADMAD